MIAAGRRGTAARAVLLAGLGFAAGGCGSSETNPPPAEPAASPPLSQDPAGVVVSGGATEAEGVAVDPQSGLAAVSYRDPDRVELIEIGRAEVTTKVPTPDSARHLGLAGPGGPVLAPIEYEDQLLEIELPSGRTRSVPVGDFPHDAVAAEDGRIFVGDEGGDTISVLEGGRTTETLAAPEQPGGIAYAAGQVAVVAVAARLLAVYDTETLEQVAELPAGAGPSHVVAGDDGRFYVTDTGGDAILVYAGGDDPRLLDRTNVSDSPYGIAIDNRRHRLWVTRTGRNQVAELQITDLAPKIIASYPTVRQPNSVGVDERTGRVVVVGRDRGDVQIIDPARDRPLRGGG